MLGLTLSAHVVELGSNGYATWGRLFRERRAGSGGIMAGALLLPSLFAGLVVRRARQQRRGQFLDEGELAETVRTALSATAAAALSLLVLAAMHAWQEHSLRRQQQPGSGSRQPPRFANMALVGQCSLPANVLVYAVKGVMKAAGSPVPAAMALLAVAATAATGTPLLLALLPRTLTVGEAMVAAQAAALLGSAALRQLLGPWAEPFATPPSPHTRFVVLLSAGSLLAAAALIPLLLRCQARAQRPATRSSGSGGGGGNSRRMWVVAAALVAAAAGAALCPAAAWAARLALSTRRRRLLCAWWGGCLATALPAQHWVNSRRLLPPIIGEACWLLGGAAPPLLALPHADRLLRLFKAAARLAPSQIAGSPAVCKRHRAPAPASLLSRARRGACRDKTNASSFLASCRLPACRPVQCARATICWRWPSSSPPCCWSRRCWGWPWPPPSARCSRRRRCASAACPA
jgi:hypothetical protein